MATADYSTEIWKTIPFAPDYAVSNHGNVKRTTNRPGIKPAAMLKHKRRGKRGQYPGVDLRISGKKTAFYVHRLVALTFLGAPPSEQHEAAHNDGNPGNPRLSNLRWAVPADNNADKHKHGTAQLGERANSHKLTTDQVREIRASSESAAALASRYPVKAKQIRRVRARENWGHVA